MPLSVSDRGSNKAEQIDHAAEVLGKSVRRDVFRAIYTGKAAVKSVPALMDATGLNRNRVLDAGKRLADQDLVEQVKVAGLTCYKKIAFFQHHRDKIIKLAGDPAARERLPTKRRPAATSSTRVKIALKLQVPKKQIRATLLTVDDIESFSLVRSISTPRSNVRMPETQFKDGIARIVGEVGSFKDWGGEIRDLSTTRLMVDGRRRSTAFAFKGPGKRGRLTPAKMGINGDQIQRLMRCPAEVFIVQYWAEIDDSVLDQLKQFAELLSYFQQKEIYYGVIDGSDSARLIAAYPRKFVKARGRR
ncbi:MAG: hypothetical protein J0M16_04950 [Gammaproteobacteria bacterium]|nr:hypothetical protein [Gammaproteobacteria bacterium]